MVLRTLEKIILAVKSPDEAKLITPELKKARRDLDWLIFKDKFIRGTKIVGVPLVVGGATLAAIGGTNLDYLIDGYDPSIFDSFGDTWNYVQTVAGKGLGVALIGGSAATAFVAALPDTVKIVDVNGEDKDGKKRFDMYMDGALWVGAAALGGVGLGLLGYDAAISGFLIDTLPAWTPELYLDLTFTDTIPNLTPEWYLDEIPNAPQVVKDALPHWDVWSPVDKVSEYVGGLLPNWDLLKPIDWTSEHLGNLFSVFKACVAAPMTAYAAHYGVRFLQHGWHVLTAAKNMLLNLPAAVVGAALLAPAMIGAFAGYDVLTDGTFLAGAAATYGLSFLAKGSAGSATRMMSTILASYSLGSLYHAADLGLSGYGKAIADYAATGATFVAPAAQMAIEAVYGHFRVKHESPEYKAAEEAEVAFAKQRKRLAHYSQERVAARMYEFQRRKEAAEKGSNGIFSVLNGYRDRVQHGIDRAVDGTANHARNAAHRAINRHAA